MKHSLHLSIPALLVLAGVPFANEGAAQPVTHLADPPQATSSRWDAQDASFEADLRARLIAPYPGDARANFVAAALETTDTATKVKYLAVARGVSPQDRLYLAALGMACSTASHPLPPECAAMDRLADWARRDDANGLPALLLADRARLRGERPAVAAYLEQAARASAFDDYSDRMRLVLWDYAFASPVDADPATRARWATGRRFTNAIQNDWVASLRNLCLAGERTESWRAACGRLGVALGANGASLQSRVLGDMVVARNTDDTNAKLESAARLSAVNALNAQCGAARLEIERKLESADPRVREDALDEDRRWVEAFAKLGEADACGRARNGAAPQS